ncbi:polysaccharide biosynthesis/export family protein [Croceibacterium sp. TMG7-5b_MA50]|uniref:polysaccharide biosynthesis/export family protein n=1 Tax=Croceibacterium sp. TMG7-5b_MA50 TaxID=3121290 RepID=UPI0032221A7D
MADLLRTVRTLLLVLVLGGACAITAGCAGRSAPPITSAAAAQSASAYRLGLGDKVRINVFGQPELSGEYQITGSGTVSMPLIGAVSAVGLTAEELEAQLTQQFAAGYLQNPSIVVEVFDFRPYFVLGEVERPGSYPAREGVTLLGAIATAGGYTYRANQSRVFIQRAGDDTEYEADPRLPLTINPGDVIRVGERYF